MTGAKSPLVITRNIESVITLKNMPIRLVPLWKFLLEAERFIMD